MTNEKNFYTVKEVAEELHTTERTVRELIKSKHLKAKKIGVKYIVTIESIKDYLNS